MPILHHVADPLLDNERLFIHGILNRLSAYRGANKTRRKAQAKAGRKPAPLVNVYARELSRTARSQASVGPVVPMAARRYGALAEIAAYRCALRQCQRLQQQPLHRLIADMAA